MRIARAAREYPGGRVLVIVGSMHKDDLEMLVHTECALPFDSRLLAG